MGKRAAVKRRSMDEIATEVCKLLGIRKAHKPVVQRLLSEQAVFKGQPPVEGYRTENLAYLKKFREQVAALRKTIMDRPNHMLSFFLFEPESLLYAPLPGGNSFPILSKAIAEAAQKAAARSVSLIGMLAKLEICCNYLIKCTPGKHRSAGTGQLQAARRAKMLMEMVGRRPTTSSPQSPYRVLAGLLYEAQTGVASQDLERACKEALRSPITVRSENFESLEVIARANQDTERAFQAILGAFPSPVPGRDGKR
jgi:hypothetical protein